MVSALRITSDTPAQKNVCTLTNNIMIIFLIVLYIIATASIITLWYVNRKLIAENADLLARNNLLIQDSMAQSRRWATALRSKAVGERNVANGICKVKKGDFVIKGFYSDDAEYNRTRVEELVELLNEKI